MQQSKIPNSISMMFKKFLFGYSTLQGVFYCFHFILRIFAHILFLTNRLLNMDAINNGGQSASKTKKMILQMKKLMVELVKMKTDANQASNGGKLSVANSDTLNKAIIRYLGYAFQEIRSQLQIRSYM